MQITLYDSRRRELVPFLPIVEGKAGIYTCGPTVYSPQHLGNMRSQLYPDLLRRVLAHEGFEVTFVTNITDVGHLTSDGDTGDDKMELAAKRDGKTADEIATFYANQWAEDRRKLHCLEPTHTPHATAYIQQQIDLAKILESKGHAYVIDDGLYFDVATFPRYAEFAGLDLAGMEATDRVDNISDKHSPADFALWKKTAPGVHRLQEWDSPWGKGAPGWHLECSVMSSDLLGEHFDIHTGGIDHLRVHHTNEVAQSEAAYGVHPWVNYWLHNEFLNFSGVKMSKSKGNVMVVDTLAENGIDPLAFRWFFMQAHYRQQQVFTFDLVRSAGVAMQRVIDRSVAARDAVMGETMPLAGRASELSAAFWGYLADDLNAPRALAVVAEILKDQSLSDGERWSLMADADTVLGLGLAEFEVPQREELDPALAVLMEKRTAARAAKDWASADAIRDELKALGWEIIDTPEGPCPRRLG